MFRGGGGSLLGVPPPRGVARFGVWVCSQSLRPPCGVAWFAVCVVCRGSRFGSALSPSAPLVVWCGSRFGSPWVFRNRHRHHRHPHPHPLPHHHHYHRHRHVPLLGQLPQDARNAIRPTVAFSICKSNTLMAESSVEAVHFFKDRLFLERDPRDS